MFTYDADGNLLTEDAEPAANASYRGGMAFNPETGALYIGGSGGYVNNGLDLDATGRVKYATSGAIAAYHHGWPLTALGEALMQMDQTIPAGASFTNGAFVGASGGVFAVGGAPGIPEILFPVNQEIITEDIAYNIVVSARGNTVVTIYDGVTELGQATDNLDNTFTYAWTPASPDYDVNLTAVGDVTGISENVVVVVAEANAISQDFTNWTKSNASITVTGGQADPDGGTAAYLVTGYAATNTQMRINKAATVTPTEFNSGFEIWAKPNGLNVLMIYPLESGADNYGYLDLSSGQSLAVNAFIKIVETKDDGWVRVWFNFQNATAGP
jgi:hypothetical protein